MAIQFIPLIAAIVGGAATVGAGAYAYKNYQDSREQQPPSALITPVEKPEIAKPLKVEPEKVETVEQNLPVFHVLRVEEDGSVLMAGAAEPSSLVEVLHGENVLAKTSAADNGDFVIVFDNPLKPGVYELFIRSTLKDNILLSAEAGIIKIPEAGEEVIAMVAKPGKATKLIQIPAPVVKPDPVPVAPVSDSEKPVEAPVAKVEPEKPTPVVEQVAPPKPAPVKPVLLGAVEVEGDKLFIAGSGEPGRIVNLYLNDVFVGETKVSPQGSYLLETVSSLKVGKHVVRADMLALENAVVIARAQVPLIHDAPQVAEVTEPEQQPAPVIIAKAPEPVDQPSRNLGAVAIENPEPVAEIQEEPKRIIRTSSSVIIRKGDNLWRVSRRVLGRGIRYSTIYNANKSQIKNPSLIFPGQIFKIPEKMADTNATQEG